MILKFSYNQSIIQYISVVAPPSSRSYPCKLKHCYKTVWILGVQHCWCCQTPQRSHIMIDGSLPK